jgi:hypothetical protein
MWLSLGLFLAGAVFTSVCFWMLFKRRLLMAGVNGLAGFSLLSVSIILILILVNIHTYQKLTSETEIAQVEIGPRSESGITIKLISGNQEQEYLLNGQMWQLDARFLKWKSWAYLLGSEPLIKLERLTSRMEWHDQSTPLRYDLSQQGFFNNLGSKLIDWVGMIDTYYGSSVYMPSEEGAVYTVSASVSGLVVRAGNPQARMAQEKWMDQ